MSVVLSALRVLDATIHANAAPCMTDPTCDTTAPVQNNR
jgi:hypothetical protein